jgi:hypothetical protein
MLRFARLLVIVCAALAILAGGSSAGWAGKSDHTHHHCDGMAAGMAMDDCLHGDPNRGDDLHGCPPAVCVATTLFVVPQSSNVIFITTSIMSPPLPTDEAGFGGPSGPPELRPPIA